VNLHSRKALEEINFHNPHDIGLTNIQTKIISGAFDLSETRVETITTTIDKVFSISIDAIIDKSLIDEMR
jgi:CBS domain containing-hemolysin-like protein